MFAAAAALPIFNPPFPGGLPIAEVFSCGGITAFEIRADRTCDFRIPGGDHLLMCRTRYKSLARCEMNGRTIASETMPGEMALAPGGAGSNWCLSGPQHTLCLLIQAVVIEKAAEQADLSRHDLALRKVAFAADPALHHLSLALFDEMQARQVAGSVSREALTRLVAVHLIRRYSSLNTEEPSGSAGLPAHKLRCILEFIAQNYHRNLELSEMAQLVRMTPFYFLRLFKRSTGQTPHQYLLQRRVDRAKELLAADLLSLADISLEVGFSNQSHFGTIFLKMTGCTPKVYRNRALNQAEGGRAHSTTASVN